MSWRDLGCGEPRAEHTGNRATLAGWAARRRDHGGLVFIDLRDESGLCQLVVNPERAPDAAVAAHGVRNEFVLQAEGEIARREPDAVNAGLPTGEVELQVDRLEVLSRCPPLPFQLDEEGVDETLRLRYRWLDLRGEHMQRNLRLRATLVATIRRVMEEAGFVDVQTPVLWKPTPEGARDFLVPSRLRPGRFFALPQSPQIAKQLLVIGGFERYPVRPGQVGRRYEPGLLNQSGEVIRCALERQPVVARLERRDGVHLAGNLENQIVAPLDGHRRPRQRPAGGVERLRRHAWTPTPIGQETPVPPTPQ